EGPRSALSFQRQQPKVVRVVGAAIRVVDQQPPVGRQVTHVLKFGRSVNEFLIFGGVDFLLKDVAWAFAIRSKENSAAVFCKGRVEVVRRIKGETRLDTARQIK